MTWTKAETAIIANLVGALVLAGMVDAHSVKSTDTRCIFVRDFLDDKTHQKGESFLVYSPMPENWSQSADNGKIIRTVSLSVVIGTTASPSSVKVIELRERFEQEAEKAGFRVRFTQSGFDDQSKLYVFEYRLDAEAGDE